MPPAGNSTPTTWLSKLTIAQLRRVAFVIGAPSSGTKPVLTRQIQRELGACSSSVAHQNVTQEEPHTPSCLKNLSIVSIDMGIRNLAYAHLISAPVSPEEATGSSAKPSTYQRPFLVAWKRVIISGAPNGKGGSTTKLKMDQQRPDEEVATTLLQVANEATTDKCLAAEPEKEAFDPSTLANRAYRFIKGILNAHQPTHVLIERQRFRSGGASAVQEWTIRVGVFEGMLHAVLKTLSEEQHGLQVLVHGVDPGRVTRYWLEGRAAHGSQGTGSARESKKAKIDIVGESLGSSERGLFDVGLGRSHGDPDAVKQAVDAFLTRWSKTKKKEDRSREDQGTKQVVKLDDLSDCLLQGVAWLNWQNKRQNVLQNGLEAFADDPLFVAVRSSRLKPGPKKQRSATRETGTQKP